MKFHYFLAVTTMCALEYHLCEHKSIYRWSVMCAAILWLLMSTTAGLIAILGKRCRGKTSPIVTISVFQKLLQLEIDVPKHWNIQPGQYVRIWMPHMGLRAFLQLPLFYVAFWENRTENDDKHEYKKRTLYVLTRPRRSGLTVQLYENALVHESRCWAIILGPYGRSNDFSEYGTVLFVVEDIGFMRVLPFIRKLVVASQQRQAMVRKLQVVWQMDDIGMRSPVQADIYYLKHHRRPR